MNELDRYGFHEKIDEIMKSMIKDQTNFYLRFKFDNEGDVCMGVVCGALCKEFDKSFDVYQSRAIQDAPIEDILNNIDAKNSVDIKKDIKNKNIDLHIDRKQLLLNFAALLDETEKNPGTSYICMSNSIEKGMHVYCFQGEIANDITEYLKKKSMKSKHKKDLN